MKIDTSFVNLSSSREFKSNTQVNVQEETQFTDLLGMHIRSLKNSVVNSVSEMGTLSPMSVENPLENKWYRPGQVAGVETVDLSSQFINQLKTLRDIMETICSRINSTCLSGCSLKTNAVNIVNINSNAFDAGTLMEYQYTRKTTYSHYESENTDFYADGEVIAADGRTFNFAFHLGMDRSYMNMSQFIEQEKGHVLIDPLVINYDRPGPALSDAVMKFDMDLDGEEEDIRIPEIGTAFLSLDKNGDGEINDGSELFGPSTGRGFLELSEYDDDGDFWIDEDDAVFDELTIWEAGDDGQMSLRRLKDAGIGAIYLVSAPTPFDIRDDDNQLLAKVKRTGIALNEDGSQGSVSEMDWIA